MSTTCLAGALTPTDKGMRSEHGEHHCPMPAPLNDTQILGSLDEDFG